MLALKTQAIINIILKNRGLKIKKEIEEFLNPPSPYLLNAVSLGFKKGQLAKAIGRIKRAITNKEKIIIYGDYDADGISATAIMWETLHHLGASVLPFIPQREEHGYGLNKKGIDEILKPLNFDTIKLLITVDNGIVATQGAAYARQKGIDVIITDHHQPPKKLPKALAIIHSTKVSGAGVAWFLAKEIYKHFHHSLQGFKASNSLELACIGTITDLMPMLGVNRSLVKFGLEELRKSQRPGIKALCNDACFSQEEVDTYHIGFILGPRLNAMGRLEEALESLRLICTRLTDKADGLAKKLGSINRQRQQLTESTFQHARKFWLKSLGKDTSEVKSSNTSEVDGKKIIFISHKSYNQGVIGLVAGRLVEEFYRPAIVIAEDKEYSKGSARSVKGFDIIRFLRKLNNLLALNRTCSGSGFEDLGGHPMAAGFTIKTEKIKELKTKLSKLAKKQIRDELLVPKINVDLEIGFADINWKLYQAIEKFAPFGLGNPKPVFLSRQVKVLSARTVGRENKHLKLQLTSQLKTPRRWPKDSSEVEGLGNLGCGGIFNAIGFGFGHLAPKIKPNDLIDIYYTLEKNEWNGNKSLELRVKDIKRLLSRGD